MGVPRRAKTTPGNMGVRGRSEYVDVGGVAECALVLRGTRGVLLTRFVLRDVVSAARRCASSGVIVFMALRYCGEWACVGVTEFARRRGVAGVVCGAGRHCDLDVVGDGVVGAVGLTRCFGNLIGVRSIRRAFWALCWDGRVLERSSL